MTPSTAKKRILHICTVGVTARVFLLPVFSHLVAHGFDVHFACTDDEDARYVANQKGISFFPVKIPRSISPRDAIATQSLVHYIRKHNFPIVNTHTSKAGFVGRLAAVRARTPCIIHTAHGTSFHPYRHQLINRFYLSLERWIAQRTHAFIAVTDTIKNTFIENNITTEDKISTIPNGIDITTFSPDTFTDNDTCSLRDDWTVPHDATVVCAVSRLVPHKGLENLIDAFVQLNSTHANAYLVIAGDGPLANELKNRVPRTLHTHIKWLGWHTDIAPILYASDIFCLPTLREGFGYVFLEAQAMKKPVVTSRIAPLTETMIENETALFVPPHSTHELQDALEKLITNPKLRKELGSKGRQRVIENYTQQQQLESLTAFYTQCIKRLYEL